MKESALILSSLMILGGTASVDSIQGVCSRLLTRRCGVEGVNVHVSAPGL